MEERRGQRQVRPSPGKTRTKLREHRVVLAREILRLAGPTQRVQRRKALLQVILHGMKREGGSKC